MDEMYSTKARVCVNGHVAKASIYASLPHTCWSCGEPTLSTCACGADVQVMCVMHNEGSISYATFPKCQYCGERWPWNLRFFEHIYNDIVDSPLSWGVSSTRLKVAADRLDPFSKPPHDKESASSLLGVYRYLIGMSVECLLKGIFVAEKASAFEGRRDELIKQLKIHKLRNLSEQISLTFTPKQKQLLDAMEDYIIWAGRYPMPLRCDDYFMLSYGTPMQKDELQLRQYLVDHLKGIGWMTNANGSRSYLTKPNRSKRE